MRYIGLIATALLAACASTNSPTPNEVDNAFIDLSKRAKPDPVVTAPWREVVIGAPDIDEIARFWTEIGGFEVREQSVGVRLLASPGTDHGFIRLVQAEGEPTRPYGAKAWDTGCYFSVMHRAKNLESIVADARALGWTTLTDDIVFLAFGPSQLHVIVLAHPPTGVQVQLYERLTTPLPESFPEFARVSQPFNIMQMVRDRDAAYDFFQQRLGFGTFYYGKPYLADEPEVTPIGIPEELTPEIAYEAAIVSPVAGMETGRMEMIAIDDDPRIPGSDLSDQCRNPVGIQSLVFDLKGSLPDRLESRTTRTPDGARIIFSPQ